MKYDYAKTEYSETTRSGKQNYDRIPKPNDGRDWELVLVAPAENGHGCRRAYIWRTPVVGSQ